MIQSVCTVVSCPDHFFLGKGGGGEKVEKPHQHTPVSFFYGEPRQWGIPRLEITQKGHWGSKLES